MTDIFVDPALISIPSEDGTKAAVETYLNTLHLWLGEALTSPHRWFYSNATAVCLLQNKQYPSSEVLQSWLRKYKDLDINIRQISKWVNHFFNEESDLGFVLEKLGYLIEVENSSIVVLPNEFSSRWLGLVKDEMHVLLAEACACKHMEEPFVCELQIATSKLIEDTTKEVEVTATILASVPEFDWSIKNNISQIFPLVFSPEDLPLPLDIINLWDYGEAGVRYAIDSWYHRDWQSAIPTPLKYSFGPNFFESINKSRLVTQELVLTKIVRAASAIIADRAQDKKYNLRPLRVSETADSPQRIRDTDGAKAWRLTITPEGVGWRMHYWKVQHSEQGIMIEFANILKKHDPEEID